MKKVLSFSLWGSNPKYTIGAIRNIKLAQKYYPDFECWFYIHKDTVPQDIIDQIQKHENVNIIFKDGDVTKCKPMMWRFEAIDEPDVEILMSRDADSRIYLREKLAYDEWIASKKIFHIMRDHPHHTLPIQGGMFGTFKIPSIPSWKELMKNVKQTTHRDYDQEFLKTFIYYNIKNDAFIHASFNILANEITHKFPTDYDNEFHFVGAYVNENEECEQLHINILKNKLHEMYNKK